MTASTHELAFSGGVLRRGFWLYAWEITRPDRERCYYVGRTGDSSSANAQSPFNRMGQHLGFNGKNNVLRRRLKKVGLAPDECGFRLVAHGPIVDEASAAQGHGERRDAVAAMESALASAMDRADYDVLNHPIACSKTLDAQAFAPVLCAFATHFDRLPSNGATP